MGQNYKLQIGVNVGLITLSALTFCLFIGIVYKVTRTAKHVDLVFTSMLILL